MPNHLAVNRGVTFKLSFLLCLLMGVIPIYADELIVPDDPNINYFGRFDMSNPAEPRYNWSGATIEASFPGPLIGMRVEHSDAHYDIEIDGVHETVVSTGSDNDFVFRTDLSSDIHTVKIILRNENHWSAGMFLGLYIADGKSLSPAPEKPTRKIEFIGDSYTAGYGVESPERSCSSTQLNEFTNVNKTYAAMIAHAFHAQSVILGWSGAGMVRNYGASGKRSDDPFPTRYDKTLGEVNGSSSWDFSTWQPDLVVINLGTNDYSTTPHPDDDMYIGDYHTFIERVLGNYPNTAILCVSTGNADLERNLKQVVAEETDDLNHPKVYFAAYPNNLSATGCDWHPSIEDNKNVAELLIPTIMGKMDWDTTAPMHVFDSPPKRQARKIIINKNGIFDPRIDVSFSAKPDELFPLQLIGLDGRPLQQAAPDMNGNYHFFMNGYEPGVYLIGDWRAGWVKAMWRQ